MAARARLRPFQPRDAKALIRDLRAIDAMEWRAMLGTEPSTAALIDMAAKSGQVTTARYRGRVAAVYGVIRPTLLSTTGHPWLLATDVLEERDARREFVRLSRVEAGRLFAGYRTLWNAAAEDNTLALRWLEWLGFTLARHSPVEVRGVRFVPFWQEF